VRNLKSGEDTQYRKISITIPEGMYDWLEKHREINRSQLFRDAVEREKHFTEEKISPLMFLISIMGYVFSVVLICIALTPTPIHQTTRGFLGLLGGFLAFATAMLYQKEKKNIEKLNKRENNNAV